MAVRAKVVVVVVVLALSPRSSLPSGKGDSDLQRRRRLLDWRELPLSLRTYTPNQLLSNVCVCVCVRSHYAFFLPSLTNRGFYSTSTFVGRGPNVGIYFKF